MKKAPFDIVLDELHNIAGSRNSMSKTNKTMSKWISQIRKILAGNEQNHIYLITQRVGAIDIQFRELAHMWIHCQKIALPKEILSTLHNGKTKSLPVTIILQRYFKSADAITTYMETGIDNSIHKKWFVGNKYYKFYNTHELIDFSEEYL